MINMKSSLRAHAELVLAAADTIESYCLENNQIDSVSLDSITLPPTAPQNVLTARQTIINSAAKLHQLAVGPNEYLSYLALHVCRSVKTTPYVQCVLTHRQYQYLACIRWLCYFKIPSGVPASGSVSYAEVATARSVPESQLRRIASMAITSGFLSEPSPGMLAHSAASSLFATQQGLVDWALLLAELSAPTAQKMVEVTERYGETSKKTQTAFNIQHNTSLPYFDYYAQFPMWRARFASYMKTVGSFPGTDIKHLVDGFDWASLGDATVVDVSCLS